MMDSEDHENMRIVIAAMLAFPFSSKCCRASRASSKKAAAHVEAKKIDSIILLDARICPDMFPAR